MRGNAQQVVDKYQALAREATTAGDPVMAENYYQHAEHYYRLMNANGGDNRQGGRPADGDRNRENGGSAKPASGNGSAAEAGTAGQTAGTAQEGAEAGAGSDDAERAPPATASAPVEETGEPIS